MYVVEERELNLVTTFFNLSVKNKQTKTKHSIKTARSASLASFIGDCIHERIAYSRHCGRWDFLRLFSLYFLGDKALLMQAGISPGLSRECHYSGQRFVD